jgi:8-oxo-dGTP diphosphatase
MVHSLFVDPSSQRHVLIIACPTASSNQNKPYLHLLHGISYLTPVIEPDEYNLCKLTKVPEMPITDQNIQPNSYVIIPRTLCFLVRNDDLLLLQIGEDRGGWSGKLNGIGGHVQRGEDPLSSARREILEETGLVPTDLRLAGVVTIDTQKETGIGLYVFVGICPSGEVRPSKEGVPIWVPRKSIKEHDLVEDLAIIIPRALESSQRGIPFSAVYHYDETGKLSIDIFP